MTMRIEARPLPATLPDLGALPPLLTRLYAARGVQSAAELDKGLARLIPYQQLKGMSGAVDLLVRGLEHRQRGGDARAAHARRRPCRLSGAQSL
jgi:single-stranded-DNA-specific exonuclease